MSLLGKSPTPTVTTTTTTTTASGIMKITILLAVVAVGLSVAVLLSASAMLLSVSSSDVDLTTPSDVIIFTPFPTAAFAQTDATADSASDTDDAQIYLHIPSKMIAGHTYRGIAVSVAPAGLGGAFGAADTTVHLASGSPAISLPATAVQIPFGRNHAVFEILAVRAGEAEVHAAYGGLVGRSTGVVYSQSAGPHALDIILPNHRTSAPQMAGLIYLLDANGHPASAPAPAGTDIRIVGGGLVDAPRDLHIPAGATSVPVPLHVAGSGYLTAAAPGLVSDRADITYDTDTISVRLQVAPDIVLPGGRVYYTVWLEREVAAPLTDGPTAAVESQQFDADDTNTITTLPC